MGGICFWKLTNHRVHISLQVMTFRSGRAITVVELEPPGKQLLIGAVPLPSL